jgi:predicted transcriptional regulator
MNYMSQMVHMKHQVSTSLEPSEKSRVLAIAEKLHVSESWVLRRAIVQGLADVEKEVLGVSPAQAPGRVPARSDVMLGEVVIGPERGRVSVRMTPKKGKAA